MSSFGSAPGCEDSGVKLYQCLSSVVACTPLLECTHPPQYKPLPSSSSCLNSTTAAEAVDEAKDEENGAHPEPARPSSTDASPADLEKPSATLGDICNTEFPSLAPPN
ncbi:hypothetical protein EV702DRAFT_1049294 [Suillus placidus]|uniref:Uncharacterized protein n=1 Tax=Suillus placidus TaxID=48579 RepID=A0A9P6ZKT4_9AGAM|nr:hypothetical protein EV702DRAFT_1049294 [Suillus placidus]